MMRNMTAQMTAPTMTPNVIPRISLIVHFSNSFRFRLTKCCISIGATNMSTAPAAAVTAIMIMAAVHN